MTDVQAGTIDKEPTIDFSDPSLYINRELSWLEFNRRVLEEALDPQLPLLERIKFLAIFSNNLDEFYMIRVAGLKQQVVAGVSEASVDGVSPAEQLDAIRETVIPMQSEQRRCWREEILPALAKHGIFIRQYQDLEANWRDALRDYFRREIFPILTPLAVDPGRPFPHISNLSLNLAIILREEDGYSRFSRLKVPSTISRFIPVNDIIVNYGLEAPPNTTNFILLEDLVRENLDLLFPGMTIVQAHPFRVTRDADVEIAEDEASDLLETIERGMRQRRFGQVVRLAVDDSMPVHIRAMLMMHLEITPQEVYLINGLLGFTDLFQLAGLDIPDLKFVNFVPRHPPFLRTEDIFTAIRRRDILLHHPYDSFTPIVDFIRTAAHDPDVVAIKITLYRVGSNSPIVQALLEAREQDKQVAVLVELKARFDEENNIVWAKALEAQGVHVVYGLVGLKTHAKVALVVRRERNGLQRYVHFSTGNYNATTARIYTDLGFFTCRKDLADDATTLFNRLTGYAPQASYKKLMVAPEYLRADLTRLIERETELAKAGKEAHIIIKCNSLTDARMIRKLYAASCAGVKVDLLIRGICSLRPGIPGVSENIRVQSIVGRFLEHSRIYWFRNNGQTEVVVGSADLMGRNLNRRVETIFPIEDPALREYLLENILKIQQKDNVRTRVLQPDGTWIRLQPEPDEEALDSQQWAMQFSQRTDIE